MFESLISKHWRRDHDRERVASTREMFLIVVEGLEHMEEHMTELTNQLAAEGDAITSLGNSLNATLTDLANEVTTLQSNPSIPTGALDTIRAHVSNLQAMAAQVSAADPGVAAPAPTSTSPDSGSDGTVPPVSTDPGTPAPAPTDSGTPAPGTDPTTDPGVPAPAPTDGVTPGTDTAPDAAPTAV